MQDRTVSVDHLSMTYRAPVREPGLGAAMRSFVRREFREVRAVRDVSFNIKEGELVGFIGPNGAGKTTTLKMLSGVLYPTAGHARVLGFTPHKRDAHYLRQIAMIRGSRPLAVSGELTVLDALRFQQLIYDVKERDFKRNLDELTGMLDLSPLLNRQVRALSLGEKMRCGLAWSLIYRPRMLFLDEPTLGLDVSAIGLMRCFIADYNRETRATILLTSHYMADVEQLCKRVLLINHGELVFDGALSKLTSRVSSAKILKVSLTEANLAPSWTDYGEVVSQDEDGVSLSVNREHLPAVTSRLLAQLPVADITIAEPPLESVIDRVYREGA
jgi:ABC-2 type transport system ATP-binding protein